MPTDLIQFRRGTSAQWTERNPTLSAGEPGYETDTRKHKIGDGSTVWSSLPYAEASGGAGGGGDALTTNPLSQFAATTSAQLRGVISDETGTGALVFANDPLFASIRVTTLNILDTGLDHYMSLTCDDDLTASRSLAFVIHDATRSIEMLGNLFVDADAHVSGTNTGDNATNSQYSGLVTNATHTGDATGATALTLATVNSNVGSYALSTVTVNSKGLVTAASAASTTGSGSVVLATSPTLVTPALGVATATTLNGHTFTDGSSTFTGTAAAVYTFPSATTTLSGLAIAQTFSAAQTISVAGAASTPAHYLTGAILTGGTGTTNFPHVLIQPTGATPATNWSTTGTAIGVNAATGFTGMFVDFKLAGTTNLSINRQGNVISTGTGSFSGSFTGGNISSNDYMQVAATSLVRWGGSTSSFAAIGRDAVNGLTLKSAAGTATWNDASTAASGTVANRYLFGIAAPTLTATNATVTDTVASTVYIGGAPTASTNTTITTPYALFVNAGVSRFGGPIIKEGYTVATLPSTAATGMVTGAYAYVTDATAPLYLTALTGGGAVTCPVFYNGAAWVSH